MILDPVDRLRLPGVPRGAEIADYIAGHDMFAVASGDHPIDGDSLFVRILDYTPVDPSVQSYETHELYTDVQVVLEGLDGIHVVTPDSLELLGEHDARGDFSFFASAEEPTSLVVPAGWFALFMPGEAHKPGVAVRSWSGRVRKAVFKVRT